MNGWLLAALVLACAAWLARRGWRRLKVAHDRGDMLSYRAGSPARNWALALAHTMAYHAMHGGFTHDLQGADEGLTQQLRPMILHHLGLRTDLSDAQAAQQLPDALRQRWFMLDLQRPHRSDDARAAMAFACARVAFFVRCAHLLGWIQAERHWEILLLNAQRAQQCFASWQQFGDALAHGRLQWLAQGRADVLGMAFSAQDVAQWITQPRHPWRAMDWHTPLAPPPTAAADLRPSQKT